MYNKITSTNIALSPDVELLIQTVLKAESEPSLDGSLTDLIKETDK